jgi:protein-S-isoprenylcysteine O-methyltransferase Ste14
MFKRGEPNGEEAAQRPTRFPWPPVLIAATLAAAWILERAVPASWPGPDDRLARIAGYVIGVAGLALMAWALFTLRRARTTVLPHHGVSVLVTNGPFRFRRNPIYLGEVMIFLGLAELTKSVWLLILAPVFALLITWLAILPEERHLEARFGDAFRAYRARTRRWI